MAALQDSVLQRFMWNVLLSFVSVVRSSVSFCRNKIYICFPYQEIIAGMIAKSMVRKILRNRFSGFVSKKDRVKYCILIVCVNMFVLLTLFSIFLFFFFFLNES